eukprot:EG_transcript_19850
MPEFLEDVALFDALNESEDSSETSDEERYYTAEVLNDIVLKLDEALLYLDEETEADMAVKVEDEEEKKVLIQAQDAKVKKVIEKAITAVGKKKLEGRVQFSLLEKLAIVKDVDLTGNKNLTAKRFEVFNFNCTPP